MGTARYSFDHIVGNSEALENALRLARIAANGDSTVLITGESGTGKELFAQAVHSGGHRSAGPFVVLNCGAVPRDLVESLLFGYAPGTFTGGKKEGAAGAFEKASGGTLFLDEIGEMPLSMQVKLLRVLQERRVCRVGGSVEKPVDIRVVAATNKNLEFMAEEGTFRGDLYWRLNVIEINIPSLRRRPADIEDLSKFFIKKIAKQLGKNAVAMSSEMLEAFQRYYWPGNVRELENLLEREINLAEPQSRILDHIPDRLLNVRRHDNVRVRAEGHHQDVMPLAEVEKREIVKALKVFNGNISEAALKLGISRATLYRKAARYGCEPVKR